MRFKITFIHLLFSISVFIGARQLSFAQNRLDVVGGWSEPMLNFGSNDLSRTQSYYGEGFLSATVRYTFKESYQEARYEEAIIQCVGDELSASSYVSFFLQYQLSTHKVNSLIKTHIASVLSQKYPINLNDISSTIQDSFWMEHSLNLGAKYNLRIKNGLPIFLYAIGSLGVGYLSNPSVDFSFSLTAPTTQQHLFNINTDHVWGLSGNLGGGVEIRIQENWGFLLEGSVHYFKNMTTSQTSINGEDNSVIRFDRDNVSLLSVQLQAGFFLAF